MLAGFAWLGSHWLIAACALVALALCVFFPQLIPLAGKAIVTVCRWLLGSQEGRICALAVAAAITFHVYGNFRYGAGRAAVLAEQKAAASRAQANAAQQALKRDRAAEAIGDKTRADTAAHIEQGKTATTAAVERTRGRIESDPAVAGCAGPDPGVMRDVAESAARVRAAEDRMRRIGATPAR